MKPIEVQDLETRSADLVDANVDALRKLFPEAFTESRIDFEVLKQLLGGAVDERDEKYGLNWHGKRQARQLALTPSTGTLRPAPEDSVEWDTTQNLMIEGDNLEVLKLLQKSYAGEVKMIYIDPPYNTGKDFVYHDDFRDNIGNYLELTAQANEEGRKIVSNPESSGRFHTDWLNMLYPRLKLAHSLLCPDGSIFISIDEKEISNLREVCDLIFGEECFVAILTVLCNPKGRSQDKYFATNHEYIAVYSKSVLPKGAFAIAKEEDQIEAEYTEEDSGGKYRLLELRNTHREFGRHNRRNLYYPLFVSPDGEVSLTRDATSTQVLPTWDDGFEGCWTWDTKKAERDIALLVGQTVRGRMKIYRKSYASGSDRMLKTILIDKSFYTEKGQKVFNDLFGSRFRIFQSPKSPFLLQELIKAATNSSSIVLDFFAGSGTFGQAVMQQNADDGGSRSYILIQLPQPLEADVSEQKDAFEFCESFGKPPNLAEITKERLRRSASKTHDENPMFHGDLGFRVFKLDSTNIRPWEPNRDRLSETLEESVEHIKAGRTEQDILYEVLLKLGLELTVPIETRIVTGKTIYSVGAGTLLVCLAESIATNEVEPLALGTVEWHKVLAPATETTVVFRDSAFADDVAKTNLTAILTQHGMENVRSL